MGMPQAVFTTTFTSGQTLGDGVDFGHSWAYVSVEIPTAASGDHMIYGSSDDVTYRPIHNVSSVTAFLIPSACSQRIVPVQGLAGVRYAAVRNTSGCTDVTTIYKFICGD